MLHHRTIFVDEMRILCCIIGGSHTIKSYSKLTPSRHNFAMDFRQAQMDNKAIVDVEYHKILKEYKLNRISDAEYEYFCDIFNKKLDSLNSDWLKENARLYGYKYSVIDWR